MHEPNLIGNWRKGRPRWDGDTGIVESELDGLVEGADENSVWGTLGLVGFESGVYTTFEGLVPLAGPAGGKKREGD